MSMRCKNLRPFLSEHDKENKAYKVFYRMIEVTKTIGSEASSKVILYSNDPHQRNAGRGTGERDHNP